MKGIARIGMLSPALSPAQVRTHRNEGLASRAPLSLLAPRPSPLAPRPSHRASLLTRRPAPSAFQRSQKSAALHGLELAQQQLEEKLAKLKHKLNSE